MKVPHAVKSRYPEDKTNVDAKFHDANVNAAFHKADECLQQETGKPQGSGGVAFRSLQFRTHTPDVEGFPGDGSWSY